MNRIVYLLCELKARDFESRAFIAAELLQRGCPVVLGQRWSIAFNAPHTQRGCYLFPTSNAIQAATMVGVQDAGHLIVAADEEALALTGDAVLLNVAPATLERAMFLAHGASQHARLRQAFPQADIRLCGSARIDLLRQEKKVVRASQARPYILFNTNFPMTNGLWGDREAAAQPLIQAGLTDIDARFAFEDARKAALMPVLAHALDLPAEHIVIRPHPAEDPRFWQDLVRGRPNAEVIVGHSPAPWIAGARIVVHADCTTGLEAAVMGKPCLNISTHAWGERFLMRAVNSTVESADDGWLALKGFVATGSLPAPAQSPDALFPRNGAQKTAETLLNLFAERRAHPLSGQFRWEKVVRPDVLKHKFTVTRAEVEAASGLGRVCAAIHEMDDSVFLLLPKAAPLTRQS